MKILQIENNFYKLHIKRNSLAKRIILRVSNSNYDILLTLPKYETEKNGLKFITKNKNWILEEIKKLPQRVFLADKSIILYKGEPHQIIYLGDNKNFIFSTKGKIFIFCKKSKLEQNLNYWLKNKAKDAILRQIKSKINLLGTTANKIRIKDLKTCWGSCCENGNLSFSWRLILAPPVVLEYIVVHELCHLIELNHSKKFWELLNNIFPNKDYSIKWLKKNGSLLHNIG